MKKRESVSKIMSTDLVTVNHTDDLATAEELFKSHGIRHIPVVSGEEVIGILSYTDLMRISYADNTMEAKEGGIVVNSFFTIKQVMAKDIITVSSNTIIKDVAALLATKEFHALPVVDNGKLVGIVTTTDLIKYLLAQY